LIPFPLAGNVLSPPPRMRGVTSLAHARGMERRLAPGAVRRSLTRDDAAGRYALRGLAHPLTPDARLPALHRGIVGLGIAHLCRTVGRSPAWSRKISLPFSPAITADLSAPPLGVRRGRWPPPPPGGRARPGRRTATPDRRLAPAITVLAAATRDVRPLSRRLSGPLRQRQLRVSAPRGSGDACSLYVRQSPVKQKVA